jgi:hypothetical protein
LVLAFGFSQTLTRKSQFAITPTPARSTPCERWALNGADGISDIEGKVTRVGASERGANEFQRGNDRRQHAANARALHPIRFHRFLLIVFSCNIKSADE